MDLLIKASYILFYKPTTPRKVCENPQTAVLTAQLFLLKKVYEVKVVFMLATHLPSWLRDWVCLLETKDAVSVQAVYCTRTS